MGHVALEDARSAEGGNVALFRDLAVRLGIGEGRQSTQLGRSPAAPWGSALGHEERFPPTRLSAGYGFRKETIARMSAMGEMRRERPSELS